MGTAHLAKGVNHRHNDEAEGQRNARVTDHAATDVIDDDGSGAREDEGEGAEEFGEQLVHELAAL
jgi:hypothetical protein